MTTFRNVASTEVDADSPLTSTLMTALADNPKAIAEGSTDATVAAAGWHPYNMVNIGDGNDGEVYDHGTDGAVATVETPDFADGYEYRAFLADISPSVASVDLEVEMYRDATGYDTATAVATGVGPSVGVIAMLELAVPRYALTTHQGRFIFNSGSGAADPVTTAASADKVLRLRFSFSGGNIAGGKIFLLRRRDPFTG